MSAGRLLTRPDSEEPFAVWVVLRVLDSHVSSYGGRTYDCALYELRPYGGGAVELVRQLSQDRARRAGIVIESLRWLPACETCGAAAGWTCADGCSLGTEWRVLVGDDTPGPAPAPGRPEQVKSAAATELALLIPARG